MPKKANPDKNAGGQDGTAMILEYLGKQNRPYSVRVPVDIVPDIRQNDKLINRYVQAIDVSANLHNKVTKTYAAKVLKDLAEKKKIEARTSGKQTVYHSLQTTSTNTATTLNTLDEEITSTKTELTALKTREKEARAELAEFNSRPLLSGLRGDIVRLKSEVEEVRAALTELTGEDEDDGDGEGEEGERERVEKEWVFWKRQVSVRKRICGDLWERCSEVVPEDMTREELKESLGLEGF